MRTNIEINDELMADAMAAGPFKTKKEAVEAGLVLLKRQAAARELLKLGGTVAWGWGDEERLNGQPNWGRAEPAPLPVPGLIAAEPAQSYAVKREATAKEKSRAGR